MPEETASFYVGIFKKDGKVIGHSTASSAELAKGTGAGKTVVRNSPVDENEHHSPFDNNMTEFLSMMRTYRNFVPLTLGIGTAIVPAMTEAMSERFLKTKGELVEDQSNSEVEIYKLSFDHYRDYSIEQDEILSAVQGSRHIPEVMVIGLISSYDAFLSNILRTIFNAHEEIIFNSERMIAFNDISRFSSIQEAKNYIIDKEVETVIRKSHHEQFKWMEGAFKTPLRSNLDVWPKFIEICERRNLLTHTGGKISQQYIDNCKEHKCQIGNVGVGEKLHVGSQYFSESVDAVSEIGIKLCYVMWRKFSKSEQDRADSRYNEVCFNLIENRSYGLAEELLKFGVITLSKGGSDRTRRMMIVNLANSVRLQGKKDEAIKIIDKEDWSATGTEFQVCSKAAKGDLDAVLALMKGIGPNDMSMDATTYRNWPVFRELRRDKRFSETFREVFGEDLIKNTAVIIDEDNASEAVTPEDNHSEEQETRH